MGYPGNLENWLKSHLITSKYLDFDSNYKSINNLNDIKLSKVGNNYYVNEIKVLEIEKAANGFLLIIDDCISI